MISQRTSDQVVTIALDSAPLANTWDARARTWSVPRATTVVQAIAAGRVDFELSLSYEIRGGTGGQQVAGQTTFNTWIEANSDRLASVLCHEFAHACGLVAAQSQRAYNAGTGKHRYDSATARRAPLGIGTDHGHYYTAEWSGSGTHCSLGTTNTPSCTTRRGETKEPGVGTTICLMYHASTVRDDGTILTNDVRFCAACLKQLRGR